MRPGLTQRDVASSLLISLSSSGQVAPNQWLNPKNGVNYQVAVQTPPYKVDSFDAMQRTPITAPERPAGSQQLLANLAALSGPLSPAIESHYDVQPVIDVYAAPDQRDLGRLCGRRDRDHRPGAPDTAARHHDRPARAGGYHAELRSRAWAWA